MAGYYRAFAFDYDGTLTELTRPSDEVLSAIRQARQRGDVVILATGRILTELRADFPDVDAHFDAIVAENGAVITDRRGKRSLVDRVPRSLEDDLLRRGVPVRAGDVLLACDAVYAKTVFDAVTDSGLECQIVRNRAALMVLPAGVTKASGVFEVLGDLGISRHSAIAVGDAENDHMFLELCEVGVAVANAVPSLKEHADHVLTQPDGKGVVELLTGPIGSGARTVHSHRWRLIIGTRVDDGEEVSVPASQTNAVIVGSSGSGKSRLAGLLVEQLTSSGYSTLIVDVEGEHEGLTQMRGVLMTGSHERLPTPPDVARLLRHRFGSVVLDLSGLPYEVQNSYLAALPAVIEAERTRTGLPHWAVLDEAHRTLSIDSCVAMMAASTYRGYLLVTYQTDIISRVASMSPELAFLMRDTHPHQVEATAALMGVDPEALADVLGTARHGEAVLVRDGTITLFTVAHRRTFHVRHHHKYLGTTLPQDLRFYFDDGTGTSAGSLKQLGDHLERCDPAAVVRHCLRHDFSRWVHDVLHEGELSREVHAVESECSPEHAPACRKQITHTLTQRFPADHGTPG